MNPYLLSVDMLRRIFKLAGNDALGQDLKKANQDVNNVIASLMSMLPESGE